MSQFPSLEQLRKQAKELLRAYRQGDEAAVARFGGRPVSRRVTLADAQFVLAREHGYPSWARLKRALASPYDRLAADLVLAATGDAPAAARLEGLLGFVPTAESLAKHLALRLPSLSGPLTLEDARLFVARFYGFATWEDLQASVARPRSRPRSGLSASPPFYKIERGELRPFPPLSLDDWDEILDAMRAHRIPGLHAEGQMTDAVLARLARHEGLTSLRIEGSRAVTDEGLRHLAALPQLERLDISGCPITDGGLAVLRHLPNLREFHARFVSGISDAGLAHLVACDRLERADFLGSPVGDGTIRALAGKPNLRHLKTGDLVSDVGLALLAELPVFRAWRGGVPDITLMGFDAEPNYLLLRGSITDAGMAALARLEGLFALNLDDSRLSLSAVGLRPLQALPHLGWLGFDATDATMDAIAALPRLRMLMCQDTAATDVGFQALARSRSLEYLWGRRCYGLGDGGFRALARMPSLRGLSVSCRNVGDAALAALPDFPALRELMPMDFTDDGFRHVGACEGLEAVWCMYCRDTGDAATAHLANLRNLRTYYAGQTRITDRSLGVLAGMPSVESLAFSACPGVTDAGVSSLSTLPRLREFRVELMPGVSRRALAAFPPQVQITYET